MKKLLAVIGVLGVLVVGLTTYNRTPETKTFQPSTPTSEVSEPAPASAGPVTVKFQISPMFSDEQPAMPPIEQKQ